MHEKSIELLNKAIADELSAVHQYMYFHFHCDDQGYDLLAGLFRRTAIEEMGHVRREVADILRLTSQALLEKTRPDTKAIADRVADLQSFAKKIDEKQIARIQDNTSKTRLSILFYSYVWDALKIARQTNRLLVVFKETLYPETTRARGRAFGDGMDDTEGAA